MITTTALQHPSYLLRIKAAVLRAVRDAHKPNRPRGIGQAEVYNRHNRPSLVIVARVGGGFEVFDDLDNDLTESVKTVLTAYHAQQRANPTAQATEAPRTRVEVLREKLHTYFTEFVDAVDFEYWAQDVAQDFTHPAHSAALAYALLSEAE